jgi:hypothetical protein
MPFATVAEAEARIAELEIDNKREARDNQTNRKGYNALKKFLEDKGFDVLGDLEEQWNATGPGKSKTELDDLNKKLDKLTKQYERSESEKAALQEQTVYSKIKGDLAEKMKDVIGGQDLIDLWVATKKIKLSENGKTVFDDDGEEIGIDKAVEKFKKNNPDRISVKQKDGGGTTGKKDSGADGSTSGNEKKKMSDEDFYKLDRKAKDEFVLSGGKVIKTVIKEEE